MRKQLGVLASLLFLCATALIWAGCSDRCCNTENVCQPPCRPVCNPCQPICHPDCEPICHPACEPVCPPSCEPVCAPPCKPVCQPACPPRPCPPEPCRPPCPPPACKPACPPPCAPEPCCKLPVRCKHPPQAELECRDGITVTARNPRMCLLGDQYPLEFDVHACIDVCDVVVTTHLPEGVSLVRSSPEAKVEGRKVTWYFGQMERGECRPAKVMLKCECEGELCACFCATAVPVRFCSLLCAKPILTCEKCGTEEVCPGDPVHYTITVSNRGSCTAEDVVITDNIPDGLEHASCQRTLTFRLGCLEPCESKTVNFCLTAVKRGKVCNTAVVTACNADSVSCQACTCVCCCAMECNKTGPKNSKSEKMPITRSLSRIRAISLSQMSSSLTTHPALHRSLPLTAQQSEATKLYGD